MTKTDYDNYAIVYACANGPLPDTDIEYFWILTREPIPSQDMIKKIYDAVEKQGFNTQHLWKTKHADCPDFPDHWVQANY